MSESDCKPFQPALVPRAFRIEMSWNAEAEGSLGDSVLSAVARAKDVLVAFSSVTPVFIYISKAKVS